MPSIFAILLVAISALGAGPADAAQADAERADYQAAFDDTPNFAPPDAWPAGQQQTTNRRPQAARRPVRLPVRFNAAASVHTDHAVRQASASEPAAPAQLGTSGRAIPLAPPRAEGAAASNLHFPTASLPTVLGSLGAVVGLFLVAAWVLRRTAPKGSGLLPGEVVEVLGRAQLAPRQQVHLVRLGNKLLLVSIAPTGVETLSEITDPLEVDRLTGLCYQAHPNGSSASFQQIFQSFEDPRAPYPGGRAIDKLDLTSLDALTSGSVGKEGGYAR